MFFKPGLGNESAASTDVNFQIVCVPTNLTKKFNQDMQMMSVGIKSTS